MLKKLIFVFILINIFYCQNCNVFCNTCERKSSKCIKCANIPGVKTNKKFEGTCISKNISSEIKKCDKTIELKSEDNFKCKSKPSKVTNNCLIYNEKKKCILCDINKITKYFLKDSKCLKVKKVINNCLKYKDDSNCKECILGYSLKENECILNKVECKKLNENGKCDKCSNSNEYIN